MQIIRTNVEIMIEVLFQNGQLHQSDLFYIIQYIQCHFPNGTRFFVLYSEIYV